MKDRNDREESAQHFLQLIRRSQRGVFKVYIGMIAGVGKTYRMLQEAHEMLNNGIDVQIGYVETHGRGTAFPPADTAFTAGCIQGLYRHDSRCGENLPYASGST